MIIARARSGNLLAYAWATTVPYENPKSEMAIDAEDLADRLDVERHVARP